MKHQKMCIWLLLPLLLMTSTGCGGSSSSSANAPETETPGTESPEVQQTEYISAVPEAYFRAAVRSGTVVQETYESRDYTTENRNVITKTAYVYLPYGYDASDTGKRYDILYLMHGWTMTAGDFLNPAWSRIVTILDNLIENGNIPPLIVVSATFDAVNQPQDFSRSVQELLVFHNDFRDNLVPYIEAKYHTYAENVTEDGLRRSREHRAFGGFSLGAVTTWDQFINNLDYVKYFLPMSGGCWVMGTYGGRDYPVETTRRLENVVTDGGWREEDFFIWQGIGTAEPDFVWAQTDNQIQEMIKSDTFTTKNLHYAIIQDGQHNQAACERQIYHGLQVFFPRPDEEKEEALTPVTEATKISDVINDPLFGDYGRLIFPTNTSYDSGDTLGNLSLTWYSNIKPARTVEIVNYMKNRVSAGNQIFYRIYSDEEIAADSRKADTGLFFFRGNPGARFAVCNAGGGFVYVGAMHDSFPHALELSKKGYNAFALIYRPGAQTACEDLSKAIAFIHEHAGELQVDVTRYSLWGGSAGARMAAWLGNYGTESFDEKSYPRPAAVIMQYTGLSEVTGNEPPTYNCVGTNDGIASWRTMQARINAIKANGTDAEIEIFNGLSHGFGLGEGTVAEGWLDRAVAFWERQM